MPLVPLTPSAHVSGLTRIAWSIVITAVIQLLSPL
jgi:hypothetical protein